VTRICFWMVTDYYSYYRRMNNTETIGIIAGGGQFPILVARAAKKRGIRVAAVAHIDETDPALATIVNRITWIRLGQLGRLIKAFKRWDVKKVLMAGSITKRKIFDGVMPDIKAIALLSKMAIFHDDDILSTVAATLFKEGIEIISCVSYLPELLAPSGCLTERKPNGSEKKDIFCGWKIAKELGRMDIGQCVVVRKKTVLAVEAIEGTDETILRGGRLGKKDIVVVKVSKPTQDMRFDIPTVGLATVKLIAQVKGSVLAIEAGKTLMFDREEMVKHANTAGIAIVSMSNKEIP